MQIIDQLTPVNHDSGREGHSITGIVIHTMVGTMAGSQARFFNPNAQVSANYGVGLDGSVRRWVNEGDTAWCNGNYQSNLTTISIEHEDGGDYNGIRPDALYNASSDLVADICRRYGIPCDREHIKGHNEVIDRARYPGGTACPDALDIDRIVREANAKLHPPAPAPAPAPPPPAPNFTVEDITPVDMQLKIDTHQWALDFDNWTDLSGHPVTDDAAGKVVHIVAKAHHKLGSTYLMTDRDSAAGYNQADVKDYTPPAPDPQPSPAPLPAPVSEPEIVYEQLPQPITYKTKLQPTNAYNFNHLHYPEISADVDYQLNQGVDFVAAGRAVHQLGSVYMMNATAFGDADKTGKPNKTSGVNRADLDGVPSAPAPTPPASTPEETTSPAPDPQPETVATPEPGSVIIPVTTNPSPSAPDLAPNPADPTNWVHSFKESVKPLVAKETVWIKDLSGKLKDVELKAGKLIPQAGVFWHNGEKFILTIPSLMHGNWFAIPPDVTGPVAKSQLHRAEIIIENLWDKYQSSIEDAVDELLHDGMKFEEEVSSEFADLADKLHGRDKLVDIAARHLFGAKKQK